MAEEQKPVEVAQDAPVAAPVVEPTPAEVPAVEPTATDGVTAPVAETAVDAPAAETAPTAGEAKEEKEEVKPVEEGHLEHKGSNFPKNFIYNKQFFWFGSDALSKESLTTYLKTEKATETAHHVAAWATHTGKGFLFFNEKSTDKTAPHGVIQLADASEPTVDGTNKFHFTSKGHKHTFKAGSTTERDNWVAQLKSKIAEAKELATTVPETETYKTTLESFKPAKVEKSPEPTKEEPVKEDEPAPAATGEEAVKEDKKEEPKRRSASRKRGSVFGTLFAKKEEEKKEKAAEDKPAEATATEGVVATEPVAEPAVEVPAEPVPVVADAAATEEAVSTPTETKADEAKPEKPTVNKRSSFFGGSFFGKKKSETAETAPVVPAKDEPVSTEPAAVSENAPVIPAVETTEPLSAEVNSPATVPTETTEAGAATNGEAKKEMKSDKRKSSLPFFTKKEKAAPTSDEEGEKTEKAKSPLFSKLRQTVKGKPKEKPVEKTEDKIAEGETAPAEGSAEAPATEEAKAEEAAPVPATEEPVATDKSVTSAPQVAATA